MSEINDFKDLLIWQKGMDIAEKCYLLTKTFPKDELSGMVQQIRRSSGDYKRFLNIAQGSVNDYFSYQEIAIINTFRYSPLPIPYSLLPIASPQPTFIFLARN